MVLIPAFHRGELARRVAAVEARLSALEADAAAARRLAAARDRDLAELGVRVDANRSAITTLGLRSADGFDRLDDEMRTGFAEMRGKLDQSTAGQQQIVELLTGLPSSSANGEMLEYRRWRDVGVRGYAPAGLPDPRFRGRWAARNATFCDLTVRTGLRRSEQAALGLFGVPRERRRGGYQRFWLAPVIAKGGSARWVYVPGSVAAELADYVDIDRRGVGRDGPRRRPLPGDPPAVGDRGPADAGQRGEHHRGRPGRGPRPAARSPNGC